MSENASEWVWQGFYGPKAVAIAAKALTDLDMRAGVWVPPQGKSPMPVDEAGEDAMFAVQTRRGNPIPIPAGLKEAHPAIVGRMIGA